MTEIDVQSDPEALALTITTGFDATPERVWQMWADPRQLERWWGPPSHPATVVEHDLMPGGRVTYYMTGPDGEQFHGWWRILAADAPHRLDIEDGFADEHGNVDESLPTTMVDVRLTGSANGGTTMVMVSSFESAEAMEQTISMGAVEGMQQALSQIAELLAEAAE